jgi:hypothetical protein
MNWNPSSLIHLRTQLLCTMKYLTKTLKLVIILGILIQEIQTIFLATTKTPALISNLLKLASIRITALPMACVRPGNAEFSQTPLPSDCTQAGKR